MYLFAFVFIYSCRFSLESDTGSQKKRQIRKGPAVWIWLWSIFLFFFFYEHFFSIQNVRWMVCKKAKRKEQFNAVLELWFFFFWGGTLQIVLRCFPTDLKAQMIQNESHGIANFIYWFLFCVCTKMKLTLRHLSSWFVLLFFDINGKEVYRYNKWTGRIPPYTDNLKFTSTSMYGKLKKRETNLNKYLIFWRNSHLFVCNQLNTHELVSYHTIRLHLYVMYKMQLFEMQIWGADWKDL